MIRRALVYGLALSWVYLAAFYASAMWSLLEA